MKKNKIGDLVLFRYDSNIRLDNVLSGSSVRFFIKWFTRYVKIKRAGFNIKKLIKILQEDVYTHIGMISKINSDGSVNITEASYSAGSVIDTSYNLNEIPKDEYKVISMNLDKKIINNIKKYFGSGYDYMFSFSNNKHYCSELIYVILKDYNAKLVEHLKDYKVILPEDFDDD